MFVIYIEYCDICGYSLTGDYCKCDCNKKWSEKRRDYFEKFFPLLWERLCKFPRPLHQVNIFSKSEVVECCLDKQKVLADIEDLRIDTTDMIDIPEKVIERNFVLDLLTKRLGL
jgi:hypothetical protein